MMNIFCSWKTFLLKIIYLSGHQTSVGNQDFIQIIVGKFGEVFGFCKSFITANTEFEHLQQKGLPGKF